MDMDNENNLNLSIETLEETERLKTGALIRCACELGCLTAGATYEQFEAAKKYSEYLGLAFQIIDDILDVVGDKEILGKEVGQDAANGKVTYVTLLGLDGAKALAKEYTDKALDALSVFDNNDYIIEGTKYLLDRIK